MVNLMDKLEKILESKVATEKEKSDILKSVLSSIKKSRKKSIDSILHLEVDADDKSTKLKEVLALQSKGKLKSLREIEITLVKEVVQEVVYDLLTKKQEISVFIKNSEVDSKDFEIQIENKTVIQEQIRILLKTYNSEFITDFMTLLNIDSLELRDISDQLAKSIRYKGIVFYFFNFNHLEFKIIGLTEVKPLFELVNTQELYFLDVPTLTNKGIPIFWIIRGIPISITLEINESISSIIKAFRVAGYNPAEIEALTDSELFIKMLGRHSVPIRFIVIVILVMVIEFLIMLFFILFKG